MKVIKILFYLFCIKFTTSTTRQQCLKNNIQKWMENQIQNQTKIDQKEKDQKLEAIRDEGNLNQMNLFNKLISNFEVLPKNLKELLQDCDFDQEELLQKCENYYGQNNCEKINNFTYAQKCPQDFIRIDLTKCKRNCEAKKQNFELKEENANKEFYIIDNNCQRYNQFFLDAVQKFDSMEDCLKEYQYCQESEQNNQFLQACPLNFKKISFLCVPYCLGELNEEKQKQIQKHSDYCVADIVNSGMPIFDF